MVTLNPKQNKNRSNWSSKNLLLQSSLILLVLVSLALVEASAAETFYLTVKANPNLIFISGSGDYPAGTVVTLDPPKIWRDYKFDGWQVDGRWTDENPLQIRMDKSHVVHAYYVKTNVLGGTLIDVIPRISDITIDGNIYLPGELPLTFSWETNSDHVISIPKTVSKGPDTRYVFDSWKDRNEATLRTITVSDEETEFIALYKIQHYLKPITEVGTVLGAGWHDEGSIVDFELESDAVLDRKDDSIRYVFNSWNKGDYPSLPGNSIAVEAPTTVKANWDIQYRLNLQTNVPDYEPFGTGWYDEGKKLALIAEEELESTNSDTKFVFEKWVSKGPNPVIIPNAHSASTTITVTEPYIIQAQYKKSFLVNVWSQFGTPVGAGFYDEGEVAEITMKKTDVIVDPGKIKKIFTGWNSHGARTMDFGSDPDLQGKAASSQNLLVFVDNPTNVTANWKSQYYLKIQSPEAKATGDGWYNVGQIARISVNQPLESPSLWASYSFAGWSGDIESDEIKERVIMNEPKVVVAEWDENNTPGIINSIILASAAGFGIVIYTKAQKMGLIKKKDKNGNKGKKPFDLFFNTRTRKLSQEELNRPSFVKKQSKMQSIFSWLLGRDQ